MLCWGVFLSALQLLWHFKKHAGLSFVGLGGVLKLALAACCPGFFVVLVQNAREAMFFDVRQTAGTQSGVRGVEFGVCDAEHINPINSIVFFYLEVSFDTAQRRLVCCINAAMCFSVSGAIWSLIFLGLPSRASKH